MSRLIPASLSQVLPNKIYIRINYGLFSLPLSSFNNVSKFSKQKHSQQCPIKHLFRGWERRWYKSSTYIGKKNWRLLILPKMTTISLLSPFANLEGLETHSVKVCNPSSQWRAKGYAARHTRFQSWTAVCWQENHTKKLMHETNMSCLCKILPRPTGSKWFLPSKNFQSKPRRVACNEVIIVSF